MTAQIEYPMPYYKFGRLCFYDKPSDGNELVNAPSRLCAEGDDREYRLVLKTLIVALFKPGVLPTSVQL